MSRQFTRDFGTELTLGNISGQLGVNIFGNYDGISAVEQTLWDQGGDYIYLPANTTLYISSTNASDTNVDVLLLGLDNTYTEIVAIANTNGQSQVAFSPDMFRVFLGVVYGAVDPLGDLYIAESTVHPGGIPTDVTKIKAKIIQGNNITKMGLYTVPAGKTAIPKKIRGSVERGDDADVTITTRDFGGVWLRQNPWQLYQANFEFSFDYSGIAFAEKTDIEIRAFSASAIETNDSIVSFETDGVLADNV